MTGSTPDLLPVPRVRSALFVPTTQAKFLAGVDRRGADAVILDLEDGITPEGQDAGRANVRAWLRDRRPGVGPAIFSRVSRLSAGQMHDDLAAIVSPALRAVLLSKVTSVAEIATLSDALAWHEGRCGLPLGSIRIWPLIETAEALVLADRIASSSPRIAYLGGATARGGDLAHAIGFEVTANGLETLYLRSHVLIAARAAGVPNPITGMYTDLDDPDGFAKFARQSRSLGYEGLMVIHPSHVALANEVFSPGAAAVSGTHAIIDALETARERGDGAIRHDGQMIDTAMADRARQIFTDHLALAQQQVEPEYAELEHGGNTR
jgi:citrate lyase subunit beta/citryl-CoA lyase